MIGMSGFTLGFFFPKQTLAQTSHSLKKNSVERPSDESKIDRDRHLSDDIGDDLEEPSLFLHAYRYF